MALVTWKYSRARGSNARDRPRDRARSRARSRVRDRAKDRRGVATVVFPGVKVVVKGDLTRDESTRGRTI